MYHLPVSFRSRRLLFGVIFVLIFTIFLFRPAPNVTSSFYQRVEGSMLFSARHTEHPIPRLVRHYTEKFEAMLSRQSRTLESAIEEYRRRYHRKPPQGFDKWFAYARARNSPIIDDFDLISESLEPFWSFSGSHLRQNMMSSLQNNSELCIFGIKSGEFIPQGPGWIAQQLVLSLGINAIKELPDVTMIFNLLDEPRVLLTGDHVDRPGFVDFVDASRKHADWNRTTQPCRAGTISSSRGDVPPTDIETFGLPFVTDISDARNICTHPDYASQHGIFLSPSNLFYTHSAVPIFTQAKPNIFADIIFPSYNYAAKYDKSDYRDDQDPLWEEKRNRLSWAGSTTGGQGTSDTWKQSHRQRFITFTSQLENLTTNFLSEVQPGVWRTVQSDDIYGQLYDAKFTAIIQCEPEVCNQQQEFFQPGAHQNHSELWHSRFLYDIDGNSFSGRFYSLLLSRSVVLKQTLFQEWHDERLYPWVHYIPVSMGMEELPEIMRYLALTKAGEPIAKDIANEGREWASRSLRKEDFGVYLYRLILEYARLISETREAGKYD